MPPYSSPFGGFAPPVPDDPNVDWSQFIGSSPRVWGSWSQLPPDQVAIPPASGLGTVGPAYARSAVQQMPGYDLGGWLGELNKGAPVYGIDAIKNVGSAAMGVMPMGRAESAAVKGADVLPQVARAFGFGGRGRAALDFFGEPLPEPQAPMLLGDPQLRGSMNTLDNIPFTYKGKHPQDWTPQEFKEVGDKFGIPNLGPETPGQTYKYSDGKGTFSIPGGTDGTFTYYDMLRMKADGIDASRIPEGLHAEIQQKLMRTHTPSQPSSEAQNWQGMMFGMTSPNNPLFPNQLTSSILRLREPGMVDKLANAIPWKAGENLMPDGSPVTKQIRDAASNDIARTFGIEGAEWNRGGLGSRGSGDYTRIAELAQLWKQNPDWFRKTNNENWQQYVERLTSQVQGLGMKTGSLSGVWQDPANASISAIDRHMVSEVDRNKALFANTADRRQFEQNAVDKWNEDNSKNQVSTYAQLKKMPGSDGFIQGRKLDYVGNASSPAFKYAGGEINPNLPPHLANADFIVDPKEVNIMGPAYGRALKWNQQIAQQNGLSTFGAQWMYWDRIRRRLEPHENMFPGLEQMPAMSRNQLRDVDMAHAESGHKDYTKLPGANPGDWYMKPTRPMPNPARFAYFSVPPIAAGAALSQAGQPQEQSQ